MKILDTSFLVDYLKSEEYTLSYLEKHEEEAFYASTLTFFELFRGEFKSEGEDLEELENNLAWLNEKEIDRKTAKEAAKIEKNLEEKGEKINLADVLIAGTAAKTGTEIITGDSDFSKIETVESSNLKDKEP